MTSSTQAAERQNSTNSTDSTTILSDVQREVVAAVALGRTIATAAMQVRVHRTTIYHWRKTIPAFREALNNAQWEYTALLRDEMTDLSGAALGTIRGILADAQMTPEIRLRAALAVLERAGWNLPAAAEQGAVDRNRNERAH